MGYRWKILKSTWSLTYNSRIYTPTASFLLLKKEMAPHSSTLAWKIPWTVEPGRLQSMGSLRVGQDRATSLSLSLSCTGEGNGNPLQCSCLENPRDGGAWWPAIYGVAQSRTRLKWLSSSSSFLLCCKLLKGPFCVFIFASQAPSPVSGT